MYVLFRRMAYDAWYLDSVHVHLVDAVKERDKDHWLENQIELWQAMGDKVIRNIIHPIDLTITDWTELV